MITNKTRTMNNSLHFLVLFVYAALASPQCYRNRPHCKVDRVKDYHVKVFESIAREIITAEKKVLEICDKNANDNQENVREVIEEGEYKILAPIPAVKEKDIQIKIKSRVLYINAVLQEPRKQFWEIRLIPTIVDRTQAYYYLLNDMLTIVFPIKVPDIKYCENKIDYSVIAVPKLNLTDIETSETPPEQEEKLENIELLMSDIITENQQSVQASARTNDEDGSVTRDVPAKQEEPKQQELENVEGIMSDNFFKIQENASSANKEIGKETNQSASEPR